MSNVARFGLMSASEVLQKLFVKDRVYSAALHGQFRKLVLFILQFLANCLDCVYGAALPSDNFTKTSSSEVDNSIDMILIPVSMQYSSQLKRMIQILYLILVNKLNNIIILKILKDLHHTECLT